MGKKRSFGRSRGRQPSRPGPAWFYLSLALAVALIVAGVGMLVWLGRQSTPTQAAGSQPAPPPPSQRAPDFALPTPAGETVRLSDYAGQVVLVNMWATWCPPCKAEMPTLNAFYEAHWAEGFVVLAVNSQEDAALVRDFIQANGFTFPVLLDENAAVMERYNVRGLPTSFVIDREGVIRYVQPGEITRQQLEAVIGPLL